MTAAPFTTSTLEFSRLLGGAGGEGMNMAALLVAFVLLLAPTSASAECAWGCGYGTSAAP